MRPKRAELGPATLYRGDCREVLKNLPTASVDSVVCDPPYELGFMGRAWDASGIAYDVAMWREVLRVLKPGGHLLAFGGTRTYHRMAVAIEDAGFEIRDCIQWLYGSGFPKSHDVSKAIDKAAGAQREQKVVKASNPKATGQGRDGMSGGTRPYIERAMRENGGFHLVAGDKPATAAAAWQGWGTALKPANEPIVVARKPLIGTVAENVTTHGTGGINVDACRVGTSDRFRIDGGRKGHGGVYGASGAYVSESHAAGRWPANVIHDGSDEVLEAFAVFGNKGGGLGVRGQGRSVFGGGLDGETGQTVGYGDASTAARFFYCAKASRADRGEGNKHPTVKPLALARYLVRLVTPPGGTMLTPFMGSGTEVVGAVAEGFEAIGIERDADSFATSKRRVRKAVAAQQPARQRVAA